MRLKRLLRGPFLWITVLLLLSFTVLTQLSSASEPEELRYDEFVALLEAGEIATVEDLVRDQQLTGTLADEETTYVVSYNPDLNGEELAAKLAAARDDGRLAEQTANPQPGNVLAQVLLSILPFVVIFGLFIFLMLRMQGGGGDHNGSGRSCLHDFLPLRLNAHFRTRAAFKPDSGDDDGGQRGERAHALMLCARPAWAKARPGKPAAGGLPCAVRLEAIDGSARSRPFPITGSRVG